MVLRNGSRNRLIFPCEATSHIAWRVVKDYIQLKWCNKSTQFVAATRGAQPTHTHISLTHTTLTVVVRIIVTSLAQATATNFYFCSGDADEFYGHIYLKLVLNCAWRSYLARFSKRSWFSTLYSSTALHCHVISSSLLSYASLPTMKMNFFPPEANGKSIFTLCLLNCCRLRSTQLN